MLKSTVLLALFLTGVSAFLTGAWHSVPASPPEAARVDFVPQSIPLNIALPDHRSEVTAADLLEHAIANLSQARWLKTTFRQSMRDATSTFVAEGVLQRGPNHCARLEMNVETGGVVSRLVIVSDGETAAQERTIAGESPVVVCEALDVADKDAHLTRLSCGGPLSLLRGLQPKLRELRLQTGLLEGRPVIKIRADVESTDVFPVTHVPIRSCSLFLDVATLWPLRIDGCSADGQRIMRVEFREPEVNQELSMDDCVRVFSFHPTASK